MRKINQIPLNLSLTRETLKRGFTLIELLVVISIISILTIISVSSFVTAQVKGRDSLRKSDLDGMSKALMMYYNDNGKFPDLTSDTLFGNENVGLTGSNGIIYMRKTPLDPKNVTPYKYVYKVNPTFKEFNLFANLENINDSQCLQVNKLGKYTVDSKKYCYGVTSPNTILKDW
jgi:prepilin-type N-terminal cleavage/methylation domain-containing protein